MTEHIMTDIETLGKKRGCIVLSVAFVRVRDEANFVMNWNIPEQQALGLTIDPDTHAWWGKQEAEYPGVWSRVTENPQPLSVALPYLKTWLDWATGGSDWLLWMQGTSFDAPIMEEVLERAGVPCPWEYWQTCDTRTAFRLACIDKRDYFVPPPHVALNDALTQSRALTAAFQIINRAHQPQRRYFYHPESDSLFFTDDGSHPAESGGADAALCNEIVAGDFIKRAGIDLPAASATVCSECHSPQFETPHGVTCANGHGGVAGVMLTREPH